MEKPKSIIKCRFIKDGEPYGIEYSYLTSEPVEVGDLVQVETQRGVADCVVTELNVPFEEVESFKDKLKYIIGKKPHMKYVKVEITEEMRRARKENCGENADCAECPCCIGYDDCIYNYEEIEE